MKEPATILSVKPITPANEEETSVTSPSDTSSTPQVMSPNDDSHVVTADDEPDLSSQPLPPDASQYFVSTSGNQRKQELPALHKAARCVIYSTVYTICIKNYIMAKKSGMI